MTGEYDGEHPPTASMHTQGYVAAKAGNTDGSAVGLPLTSGRRYPDNCVAGAGVRVDAPLWAMMRVLP